MTDDHGNVIRFPHCARRVDDLDAELARLEGLLGTTRMRYYKLDGHTPIRVETLKAWADEVAQHDRIAALTGIDPWRVAVSKIDDVVISSVFLGARLSLVAARTAAVIRDKGFRWLARPFPEPLRDMG
jgi:hypothetical protein